MEEHLFNLKFAAKSLQRESKKCEKLEKEEKNKLKKAIQKGNMEGAKIHAENSIRNKSQALNMLRMSARVDAVASRVQSAVAMKKVTSSMAGVVKSMDSAMRSMNLEKVSGLMEKFEKQFEDLDVQSASMEDTMSSSTTMSTPQTDVDNLMQQVADEAGLELNMELPTEQKSTLSMGASTAEQDELTQRLAKLRNT
ncbi:charged multivesicular body protein 1b-like isoform X2 [Anneissia japonica]|uniref:charged multivesicular body protein 1b-like isoform X2 n=1 Tax=Anneissia japonica TaxID=1529436 RepID=UPI0014255446|nr:charged multivesicular body protein 1b-like isoform X2 [Anneissia japonica]